MNKMQMISDILNQKRFWLACLLLPLGAQTSYGLGFRILHQDAAAVGRANAWTATADNPSAIYYNPAGISQIGSPEQRFGIYSVSYKVNYDGPTADAATVTRIQGVPQLFYTQPWKETPWTFGLGVYSPYGLASEWKDDAPFRTLAIKNSLIYTRINPVVAWKINEAFSLGAGPTVNYSRFDSRSGLLIPGDEARFVGDGWGAGFNAGALLKLSEKWALGLSYASRSDITYRGTTRISNSLIPSSKNNSRADLRFPQNVVFGTSWKPNEKWNIECDVDWTDWSGIQQGWNSTCVYAIGATRKLPNGYSVSAGYSYAPNSIPDSVFTPRISDYNYSLATAGLGHKGKHWSWDVSYQFGYGPSDRISGSPGPAGGLPGPNADGVYRFVSHSVSASVGYRF
ncbi:MAG: hypothetical protein RLZZ399_703 [Verrucomicrobiota bacterium]|jgi:long-chain fatty acid transport protein